MKKIFAIFIFAFLGFVASTNLANAVYYLTSGGSYTSCVNDGDGHCWRCAYPMSGVTNPSNNCTFGTRGAVCANTSTASTVYSGTYRGDYRCDINGWVYAPQGPSLPCESWSTEEQCEFAELQYSGDISNFDFEECEEFCGHGLLGNVCYMDCYDVCNQFLTYGFYDNGDCTVGNPKSDCGIGEYNDSDGICVPCPEATGIYIDSNRTIVASVDNDVTSDGGFIGIDGCFLLSGTYYDERGTFSISEDCPYYGDIFGPGGEEEAGDEEG